MEQGNIDENEYVEPPPGFAPLSNLSSAPPGFSQSVSQSSQPFYQHNPQNNKPRNERNHTKTLLQGKKKVKVIINFFNYNIFLGSL